MKKFEINTLISELEELKLDSAERDYLLTWDIKRDDLLGVIKFARIFKMMHRRGISFRAFDRGLAVSIFRDQSTRTRFSFSSAASALGLSVAELDEEKSQVAHGETVRETANMISFLTEVIGIRDDMYIGEGNSYMKEVVRSVREGAKEGVLHKKPTVVNLQCDFDHPTQSLSDLLALETYFGGVDKVRGKKITMSWAYSPSYGKPLSVPQGIISLLTRFGAHVTLAHPSGYDLLPETMQIAADNANSSGGTFSTTQSMEESFEGADVVYPKSWAPHHVMQERTKLLKVGDKGGLGELEKDCLEYNAKYKDWECNREMMNRTAGKEALYMHCLPADISGVSCDRGEVSADVFEQYRLATYREASYKPYVIAAMIFASRMDDPVAAVKKIVQRNLSQNLL